MEPKTKENIIAPPCMSGVVINYTHHEFSPKLFVTSAQRSVINDFLIFLEKKYGSFDAKTIDFSAEVINYCLTVKQSEFHHLHRDACEIKQFFQEISKMPERYEEQKITIIPPEMLVDAVVPKRNHNKSAIIRTRLANAVRSAIMLDFVERKLFKSDADMTLENVRNKSTVYSCEKDIDSEDEGQADNVRAFLFGENEEEKTKSLPIKMSKHITLSLEEALAKNSNDSRLPMIKNSIIAIISFIIGICSIFIFAYFLK